MSGSPQAGFATKAGDEQELQAQLEAARGGDSEALGQIINQLRDYLLLVANRQLDDQLRVKTAASDLVQQTLLEAGRDIISFRGESEAELRTWLVRILKHNLADTAREFRGTQRRELGRERRLSGIGNSLASNEKTASGVFRQAERDEALDAAILKLSDHYRQVITLRHVEGLAWDEIGRRMETTAEAARKTWSRALEKLKDELSQKDFDFEHGSRSATERSRGFGSQQRPR